MVRDRRRGAWADGARAVVRSAIGSTNVRFAYSYSSSFRRTTRRIPSLELTVASSTAASSPSPSSMQRAFTCRSSSTSSRRQQKRAIRRPSPRNERGGSDTPAKRHHLFTGVAFHQHVGHENGATWANKVMDEHPRGLEGSMTSA